MPVAEEGTKGSAADHKPEQQGDQAFSQNTYDPNVWKDDPSGSGRKLLLTQDLNASGTILQGSAFLIGEGYNRTVNLRGATVCGCSFVVASTCSFVDLTDATLVGCSFIVRGVGNRVLVNNAKICGSSFIVEGGLMAVRGVVAMGSSFNVSSLILPSGEALAGEAVVPAIPSTSVGGDTMRLLAELPVALSNEMEFAHLAATKGVDAVAAKAMATVGQLATRIMNMAQRGEAERQAAANQVGGVPVAANPEPCGPYGPAMPSSAPSVPLSSPGQPTFYGVPPPLWSVSPTSSASPTPPAPPVYGVSAPNRAPTQTAPALGQPASYDAVSDRSPSETPSASDRSPSETPSQTSSGSSTSPSGQPAVYGAVPPPERELPLPPPFDRAWTTPPFTRGRGPPPPPPFSGASTSTQKPVWFSTPTLQPGAVACNPSNPCAQCRERQAVVCKCAKCRERQAGMPRS